MTLNVRGMLSVTKMKHKYILCMTIHLNKYVFFSSNRWRKLQWNATNSHGSTVDNILHGVEELLIYDGFLTLLNISRFFPSFHFDVL